MVQWLRIRFVLAGDAGSIPSQGTNIPHALQLPSHVLQSLYITAGECCKERPRMMQQRSHVPQLRPAMAKYMDVCVCVCALSCVQLCDPMDCSPPGYSARGIFQVRILEWFAISYSRRSFQQRDQTHISCISCIGKEGSLPLEPLGKTKYIYIYIQMHTHTHTYI